MLSYDCRSGAPPVGVAALPQRRFASGGAPRAVRRQCVRAITRLIRKESPPAVRSRKIRARRLRKACKHVVIKYMNVFLMYKMCRPVEFSRVMGRVVSQC